MNCKHFGTCGSCSIIDILYSKELKEKEKRLLNLLSPFGVESLELFFANESHYRARAEFRIWHNKQGANYAMGSADRKGVITILECPKVIEPIKRRMTPLLDAINRSDTLSSKLFSVEFLATTTDECLVTLIYHRKLDQAWEEEAKALGQELDAFMLGRSRKQKVIINQEFVTEKLLIDGKQYIYRHYENSFTQPNPAVNIKMIEWTTKEAKKVGYGDFLESYCGLGNFTIPLSQYFDKVLATEISKRSIQAAKENCALNSINNIDFVRLSSEEMTEALNQTREFRRLQEINIQEYNFSTVLVDPPRAGLDQSTTELVSRLENIIYISCNPETLSRDLEQLTKTHKIKKVALFDQFPHTHHIEAGVILKRF